MYRARGKLFPKCAWGGEQGGRSLLERREGGESFCPEGPHLGLCCPGPYQVSLTLQQVTQPLSLIFRSHPTLLHCPLSLCSQAAGRAHPIIQGGCLNRAGQGRLVQSVHACLEGWHLERRWERASEAAKTLGSAMSSAIRLLPGAEANGQHRAVLEISASISALHLPVEEGLDSESHQSLPHPLVAGEAPAWHREQP